MKFSDIPKFTKRPSYHVNIDLEYLDNWINHHIEDLGLQLNPEFQRGHVWTKEQQISYVEYLLQGGASGKEFYFNRIGGFHNLRNPKADFVCVDGLQRLTACLAFVHNGIPVFGCYLNDFEDELRITDVMFSMNVNDLKTRKEVMVWYLEMNSGGTPHKREELDKVMKLIEKEE